MCVFSLSERRVLPLQRDYLAVVKSGLILQINIAVAVASLGDVVCGGAMVYSIGLLFFLSLPLLI